MDTNNLRIKEYIEDQLANIDFKAKNFLFDHNNNLLPKRNIFSNFKNYIKDFLNGDDSSRWVTLVGLRGVGKTTLMYQVYHEFKKLDAHFLILSLDSSTNLLKTNIYELIKAFEEHLNSPIENLDKPLFLFLDEVQYDENWGIALKNIFDSSKKVFIFSTGSSALLLNNNPDIARRTIYQNIYPLNFTEYNLIKNNKEIPEKLTLDLNKAIFNSMDSKEIYTKIKNNQKNIDAYYLAQSRLSFQDYLYLGSFPFSIKTINKSKIYYNIKKIIDVTVNKDIANTSDNLVNFITYIPSILYAIADMDTLNFTTLAEKFGIPRYKISEIFSELEKTELLNRIYPHASHFKQVTQKPSKYLFASPALRAMYYKTEGNSISEENARGKLLEDLVGMYLYRLRNKNNLFSITYDSAKGGADFIVTTSNNKIVIEVGSNKKTYQQVVQTMKKVNAKCGIILSEKLEELEYNQEFNIVKIPLKYFILI